jgi:hypothetical protein
MRYLKALTAGSNLSGSNLGPALTEIDSRLTFKADVV